MAVVICKLIAVFFVQVAWGLETAPIVSNRLLEEITKSPRPLFGMHDNVGGDQTDGFETITKQCGVRPKILSMEFGFSAHPNEDYRRRALLFDKLKHASQQGGLITLSWHQCNPTLDEPCTFEHGVQKPLRSEDWISLLSDGSALNQKWKSQVDRLARYLTSLQDASIPVLLRPYHEANIPGFWWANADAKYSKQLWKQLRTYLTDHHGIKNIVWVWSVSFHPKYWARVGEYYPGDDVVDVVGLDIYPPTRDDEPDFKRAWTALKHIAPSKPLALTEVSRLPSSQELQTRKWVYVVPWGKTMLFRDNTRSQICNAFSIY
ncbi:MAG: hypothetical protein HY273_03190 [Gammaproteobacteria bacterium]|nr:hypothetical protein [Gammaproteobacteria bacterium]